MIPVSSESHNPGRRNTLPMAPPPPPLFPEATMTSGHSFAARSFSLTCYALPSEASLLQQPSSDQGNLRDNHSQSTSSYWNQYHRSSYPQLSSIPSAMSISRPQQWSVPQLPQQGYPLPPCLFRRPSGASSTEDGNSRRPSVSNFPGLPGFLGQDCLPPTKESEESGDEETSNTDARLLAVNVDDEISPEMETPEESNGMIYNSHRTTSPSCRTEVKQSEVAVPLNDQRRPSSPHHPVFQPSALLRNGPCTSYTMAPTLAAKYENSSPISYSSGGWKGGYGQGSPSFNMIATANPIGLRHPAPLRSALLPGLPRRDTFGSVNVDEQQKRPSDPFVSAAIGHDLEECERTGASEGDNGSKPQAVAVAHSSEYVIPNRIRSHLPTEKPSYAKGASKMEVDLADILDGTRKLPGSVTSQYEITGCITVSSYGFILAANRCHNNWTKSGVKKKPVYIKVVARYSDAYRSVGEHINPEHTELALMQRGNAIHLPEYIEHYWDTDYLVIVSKRHGVRNGSTWNPFRDAYHEVNWIYYFQQAA